jgi:hypothetical protein
MKVERDVCSCGKVRDRNGNCNGCEAKSKRGRKAKKPDARMPHGKHVRRKFGRREK